MTDSIYEANETLEQLELLIGKDNARKVFEFFEGSSFYFPKLTAERRALLKAGITPPDETASASTDPVKLDVPHSRPFEPGELFYEH